MSMYSLHRGEQCMVPEHARKQGCKSSRRPQTHITVLQAGFAHAVPCGMPCACRGIVRDTQARGIPKRVARSHGFAPLMLSVSCKRQWRGPAIQTGECTAVTTWHGRVHTGPNDPVIVQRSKHKCNNVQ